MVADRMSVVPEWTVGTVVCNRNQANDTNNRKHSPGLEFDVFKRRVLHKSRTVYASF